MNPNEVTALTGVSVRTLHHYDSIGLLRPARNGENGYREYTDTDLDLLQQILFFRECGFSLRASGNCSKARTLTGARHTPCSATTCSPKSGASTRCCIRLSKPSKPTKENCK